MVRTGMEYLSNPKIFTEKEVEELKEHCLWYVERLDEHKKLNKEIALELGDLYLKVLKKMGEY